jgi:hypothetical protein
MFLSFCYLGIAMRLPVHEIIAVSVANQSWALKAENSAWSEECNVVKMKLKRDHKRGE